LNKNGNKGTRDASWRTNARGVFWSMKHAIRAMRQSGGGADRAKNKKSPL